MAYDPFPAPQFSAAPVQGADGWLAVAGEVDLGTAPALVQALEAAEAACGSRLVVDLAEMTYIDACGLSVLLAASRRARAAGREFVVARPREFVVRLLRLTAMSQSMTITDAGPPVTRPPPRAPPVSGFS